MSLKLNLNIPKTEADLAPRITVIGVGGAGGNAVNNMIQSNLEGVEFLVANADAQALGQSLCERRIQLGRNLTRGLGAGSRPDIGRAAVEESLDEIMDELGGANMVFVTAGMGGGTGTGGAPVIARALREAGMLTVGVVTKPFHFEGIQRMRLAESGISDMTQYVDTLIVIPNQNLFRLANEKTTFADAFKMADDVLRSGVRGVTDLMVMPGLINLDFADIRSVMTEMGKAMMGTGEAEGENRALAAAEAAISNPLLDEVSMKGARGVLINITGGMDLTLFEVDETANRIRDEVDPEANIIFGSTFDQSLEGRMRVSVVATGIDTEAAAAPLSLSLVSDQTSGSQTGESQPRESALESSAAPATIVASASPASVPEPGGYTPAAGRIASAPPSRPLWTASGGGMAQAAAVRQEADVMPEVAPAEPAADSFIAPQPVESAMRPVPEPPAPASVDRSGADQGSRAPRLAIDKPKPNLDRNRAQRLFARVTGGAVRAFVAAAHSGEARAPVRAEPNLPHGGSHGGPHGGADTLDPPPLAQAAAPIPPAETPKPGEIGQLHLSDLDPPEPIVSRAGEEDYLEIPTFLRRQAN